jgi:hypothetical protein
MIFYECDIVIPYLKYFEKCHNDAVGINEDGQNVCITHAKESEVNDIRVYYFEPERS